MNEPWGWHLLLDCAGGDISRISDKQNIKAFIQRLVKDIDMVPYGEPWIERFATHDPDKAGISFCQMIETSNITGHFVELNGDFYIDVFSCKAYDTHIVMLLAQEFFEPKTIKPNFIYRKA